MDMDVPLLAAIQWQYLAGSTPLEIVATCCAVLGVILIARQNILGWPLGIVWAGLSAYLAFFEWQLLSDAVVYLAYVPIQLYCWSVWLKKDQADEQPFVPTWLPHRTQALLSVAALLAVAAWAVGLSELAANVKWIPAPALLIRDSTTTVLNFFAQFLQARKRMENWVGWLIVNLLGIHIYWVKDAPVYALQYAFFLVLGLYGWFKWHQSTRAHDRSR